jgi:hypothetical protein
VIAQSSSQIFSEPVFGIALQWYNAHTVGVNCGIALPTGSSLNFIAHVQKIISSDQGQNNESKNTKVSFGELQCQDH